LKKPAGVAYMPFVNEMWKKRPRTMNAIGRRLLRKRSTQKEALICTCMLIGLLPVFMNTKKILLLAQEDEMATLLIGLERINGSSCHSSM
jgi:hypothetical protein